MVINTDNSVSFAEAGQDFARVARMVDEKGAVVIVKDNRPRYVLMEFSQLEPGQPAGDEEVLAISRHLMAENKEAYEVLAK